MNICVLIKPVADPASIRWDYREQRLDFMTPGFNRPDLHALQWACDYKQTHAARITIVTVVDPDQEIDVKPLLKYPVDDCIIIKCANLSRYRHQTALPLVQALKDQAFDLILSGSQSEDTHSGVTPAVLAEFLGIPYFSEVYQIDPASDHIWQVKRKSGRDRVQTFRIDLPAVIGGDWVDRTETVCSPVFRGLPPGKGIGQIYGRMFGEGT
ncbi:hypothetical protein SD71_20680 [Cohnella kolymensis]|uniref:Electron transfer flavoprotein small subunit n=1 Tax=Cohnella kolymensis TaxID=1590652 RepID=A0ABR5A029_9BACL|nr:hypothetical protein [Cohnella kolymensis]KIL34427.1 hypothetical protein SD71_20680 [Cohnella kolymensis]